MDKINVTDLRGQHSLDLGSSVPDVKVQVLSGAPHIRTGKMLSAFSLFCYIRLPVEEVAEGIEVPQKAVQSAYGIPYIGV